MTEMGEAKKWWEKTPTIIGAVSSALGLVVLVAGLPNDVAEALGRSAPSKLEVLELQEKRVEVAAAAARLDVTYVFLRRGLVDADPPKTAAEPDLATTIRSYPIVRNEIVSELDRSEGVSGRGCRLKEEYFDPSVAFLVVSNRGRREATDVAVTVDRLELGAPVRVDDGRDEDYLAKLRAKKSGSARRVIRIPLALRPGDGVLIPLWISVSDFDRREQWCVVSHTALAPTSLSFADPLLGSTTRSKVRRMLAPTTLADGVEARG